MKFIMGCRGESVFALDRVPFPVPPPEPYEVMDIDDEKESRRGEPKGVDGPALVDGRGW